jgi:hypothetical protein
MTALRARIDDPGFKALVDDFDQAWPNVPRTRDLLETGAGGVTSGSAVGNPARQARVIRQRSGRSHFASSLSPRGRGVQEPQTLECDRLGKDRRPA